MGNFFVFNKASAKVKAILWDEVDVILKCSKKEYFTYSFYLNITDMEGKSEGYFKKEHLSTIDGMARIYLNRPYENEQNNRHQLIIKIQENNSKNSALSQTKEFIYSFSTERRPPYNFNLDIKSEAYATPLPKYQNYYPVVLSATTWNKVTSEINRLRREVYNLSDYPFTLSTPGGVMRANSFNELTESLAPLHCFISEPVKSGDPVSLGTFLDIQSLFSDISEFVENTLPKVVRIFP